MMIRSWWIRSLLWLKEVWEKYGGRGESKPRGGGKRVDLLSERGIPRLQNPQRGLPESSPWLLVAVTRGQVN